MSVILKGTTGNTIHLKDDTSIYWYTCGPTVYSNSHIGHARTYVTNDILQRVLKYLGHNLFSVMNITNIDDKIINKSQEEKVDFEIIASQYTDAFFKDMNRLNVEQPDITTYVSDYIKEIIEFVEIILKNDMGYVSNNSVYIDINKYYEKFNEDILFNSLQFAEDIKSKVSENILKDKKDTRDFALWKKAKEGEPSWDSPWGKGRPAWHIECSVMIEDTLNIIKTEDNNNIITIHSGGEDLIFPHHENEMKQFMAKDGKHPIDIFIHYGRLNINGEKMSRSEKNYVTLENVFKNVHPNIIRTLFLMKNWNDHVEYSEGSIEYATSIFNRIINFIKHIDADINSKKFTTKLKMIDDNYYLQLIQLKKSFDAMLKNNLNIASAFGTILSAIETCTEYKTTFTTNNVNVLIAYKNFVKDSMIMFGIVFDEKKDSNTSEIVSALVKIRDDIRSMGKEKELNKSKLFELSDKIRDQIAPSLGITIEDKGKEPSIWYYN